MAFALSLASETLPLHMSTPLIHVAKPHEILNSSYIVAINRLDTVLVSSKALNKGGLPSRSGNIEMVSLAMAQFVLHKYQLEIEFSLFSP